VRRPAYQERAIFPDDIQDVILFPNVSSVHLKPEPARPGFVIGRLAAEAVLQGANPYAPGVAAAPINYNPGLLCNLFGDAVDLYKSRGVTIGPGECLENYSNGNLVFIGAAETMQSRADTFGGAQKGG